MTKEDARARRTLEGLLGVPATEGNEVRILRNGDEIFPAMLEAITDAEHTIDFLTFIYWSGEIARRFADSLAEAAGRGVRVRVLLDAVGARQLDDEITEKLAAGGCHFRWFRPVSRGEVKKVTNRTHRKVLICDEQVAFTGGVGIADEWMGDARDESEWRDTHVRVEGPAVDGLRGAFVDNWAEAGGTLFDSGVDRFPDQPQPGDSAVAVVRGTAETGWTDIATLFQTLIQVVQERLRISTAYFTPDDQLVDFLVETADRGVEVEILVPGPHIDKRFVRLAGQVQYERLLAAGIKIFEFCPTMLHTKILIVDQRIATIGSANFNSRSTDFDDEVNLVLFDPELAGQLDSHYDEDLERAQPIDLDAWSERGVFQRLAEAAAAQVDGWM